MFTSLFSCTCTCDTACWSLYYPLFVYPVGSRDHSPLSKDPLPASWDSDWLAGWPIYHREAGQEQAKAHHSGDSREAGKRPQGCEICGVLSPHAGKEYIQSHTLLGHTWFTCQWQENKEERGTCPYCPWPVHAMFDDFCSAWFGFGDWCLL